MLELSLKVFSITQFDRIFELKSDSNLDLMKINKNSKEKEIKLNNNKKVIYLLSILKFELKRYNVEILN